MKNDIKFRHEFKYFCDIGQMETLRQRIEHLIPLDSHTKENGEYTIRSLYFDNYANRCYYENESGTDPREKYRIRIYNGSSERISLECKRKERGKTLKTSCRITLEQCKQLMNGLPVEDIDFQQEVLRKLSVLIKTQLYRPVVIVEYERIPFVYKYGNVRITFDKNIRSSSSIDKFFDKDIQNRPIMFSGNHLLEVKYDEFLPDFIKQSLQLSNLRQTAFSKYYLCRKFSIGGLL